MRQDEHVARAVIHGLRQRGIDVLSVPEAGMLTASDEAHLAFATAQGRVLFTQDTDFLRLAALGASHAGVVYAQRRLLRHRRLVLTDAARQLVRHPPGQEQIARQRFIDRLNGESKRIEKRF